MTDKCLICANKPNSDHEAGDPPILYLDCPRCGRYQVSLFLLGTMLSFNTRLTSSQIANISGYTREHDVKILDEETIEYLTRLKTPSVGQKAEKLFSYLAETNPVPGTYFNFDIQDQKMWGISWSRNAAELKFLLEEYLIKTRSFIERPTSEPKYTITPKGWEYAEEIKYKNPDSHIGFIAMYFNESLDFLLEKVIEPAITAAGYEPKRIDKHEHVNRIDDEIIAMIRRSKFIVADFTGQRGGVYFEAGYALGFGLPVFWICEEQEIKKDLHFDTRQYNFIPWKKDELEKAKKSLQYRIESIIGKGKYKK